MYILFRLHNWKPGDYYRLDMGEKIIVRAFIEYEQEQIQSEINSIKGD